MRWSVARIVISPLGRLALLGAAIACAIPLRAELEWKTRRIKIDPPLGAREVEVAFPFVNRGKTPVRLLDVRSSCGCTAIAMDKERWEPGESGTLRVKYQIAGKAGHQVATLTVSTDEPGVWQHDLFIEAFVKEFVVFTPQAAVWKLGDEVRPKVLQIDCPEGFRFTGVHSQNADFSVTTLSNTGRKMTVQVTPRDTWSKRAGALAVSVARDGQPPVEVTALLRVL